MSELHFSALPLEPDHHWYGIATHLIFYEAYGFNVGEIRTAQQRSNILDGDNFYVLAKDRELCAVGGLSWYEPVETTCKLAALAVPESLRGKGYGSEMIVRLIGVARQAGATAMCLTTKDSAQNFYTKHGFMLRPTEDNRYYMTREL